MLLFLILLVVVASSEGASCKRKICFTDEDICRRLLDRLHLFDKRIQERDFETLVEEQFGNGTGILKLMGNTAYEKKDMPKLFTDVLFSTYPNLTVLSVSPTKIHLDRFGSYVLIAAFKLATPDENKYVIGQIVQRNGEFSNKCELGIEICAKLQYAQTLFQNGFRDFSYDSFVENIYSTDTVLSISYNKNGSDPRVGKTKKEQIKMYEDFRNEVDYYERLIAFPSRIYKDGDFFVVEGDIIMNTADQITIDAKYHQKFDSAFKMVEHILSANFS